jgi:uncharacterized protein YbaA (DUF1428 family)
MRGETAMAYVDGFVIPLPIANLALYKSIAKKGAKIWRDHGALAVHECIGDDVPVGKLTSFTRAVKLKQDETVIFSWIVYKSRKDRDQINKKVMADPRMVKIMRDITPPFDGKRMIFGGFKTIVEM